MTFSIVRWLDATGPEGVMGRIEQEWDAIKEGLPGSPSFEVQGYVKPGELVARVYAYRVLNKAFSTRLRIGLCSSA